MGNFVSWFGLLSSGDILV